MRRLLLALVLAVTGLAALATPASADTLVATTTPSVFGTPEYAATLTASPGAWTPAATTYAYQWLRDGTPVAGATAAAYTATLDDLGHALAVQVTATDGLGSSGVATSAPTGPVTRATLAATGGQAVLGVPRYTHRLTVRPGRFSADPSKVTYQWLRGGQDIAGATDPAYAIAPADVGARLSVRLTVLAPGYEPLELTTDPTPAVRHRIDVRRVVRYHVETRGAITKSVKQFRTQAQQTYDDARGWRSSGIEFRQVARGGAFTLVLAQASLVPSFSSSCSSMWSCRVGRYVIINQDRWKNASPAWNAAHLALRDYRHMVVNHETGHWLGLSHATCPGKGRLAPVMQQQSKGLQGCRFNPFPTAHEIAGRTPSARVLAMLDARGYAPVEVE